MLLAGTVLENQLTLQFTVWFGTNSVLSYFVDVDLDRFNRIEHLISTTRCSHFIKPDVMPFWIHESSKAEISYQNIEWLINHHCLRKP